MRDAQYRARSILGTAPRKMGDFVRLVFPTPAPTKPTRLVVTDNRCDGCRYPAVCASDRTCWRAEGEAKRQAVRDRLAAEAAAVKAARTCEEDGCDTKITGRYTHYCRQHIAERKRQGGSKFVGRRQ